MPPIYEYVCPHEHRMEGYWSIAERPKRARCVCGAWAERVISMARPIPDIEPYMDENLMAAHQGDGERPGTYVKSRQHRREVMKSLGLREMEPSQNAKDAMRRAQRNPVHFFPRG